MKSQGLGLAALAAASVLCGTTSAYAANASGSAGRAGQADLGRATAGDINVERYRSELADQPGLLLAWGGGGGGSGGGGGGGGSGGGGGGSGGGGGGSGGGGGGGSGGGGSGGGGGGSGGAGGAAGGGTGSPGGDSADRGAPGTEGPTDSLGLAALGAAYSATPAPAPDLTVVRWKGPMTYAAATDPQARLAALDPQVRDQAMARMEKGQTVSEVLDTTLLNQTARQYAGSSAYWSAPEVNTMVVVDKNGVRRPVQIDPHTLQPVSPPGPGERRPATAELNREGDRSG